MFTLPARGAPLTVDDFISLGSHANATMAAIRNALLEPLNIRQAPRFSTRQIAKLCRMDQRRLRYILDQPQYGLPRGESSVRGSSRTFSLEETELLVSTLGGFGSRPSTALGVAIAIANFKGGVLKTTTTVTLAQGLSLRGRRVLVVDLDPQGSASTTLGFLPERDVSDEMTILPYMMGKLGFSEAADAPADLSNVPLSTYWNNVDVIPTNNQAYNLEFMIPSSRRYARSGNHFWDALLEGIAPLRERYDVILFDTAPSMSYTMLAALAAADAILMPCPAEALDFASALQFLDIVGQLFEEFAKHGFTKTYDWFQVVRTKTEYTRSEAEVSEWMRQTFGHLLTETVIPKSSVATAAARTFSTAYDYAGTYDGSKGAYDRLREAYDALAFSVDGLLMKKWGITETTEEHQASYTPPVIEKERT